MTVTPLSVFYETFDARTTSESIKDFIELGGNPNEQASANGWTLLNLAIEYDNIEGIKSLVELGSTIDISNSFPPLFHALDNDIDVFWQANHSWDGLNFQKTILLIDLGANAALKNSKGLSIRDVAALYGNDVLKLFDQLVAPYCK